MEKRINDSQGQAHKGLAYTKKPSVLLASEFASYFVVSKSATLSWRWCFGLFFSDSGGKFKEREQALEEAYFRKQVGVNPLQSLKTGIFCLWTSINMSTPSQFPVRKLFVHFFPGS